MSWYSRFSKRKTTPDDTFRALRQCPFEEAVAAYYEALIRLPVGKTVPDATFSAYMDGELKKCGWTFTEVDQALDKKAKEHVRG